MARRLFAAMGIVLSVCLGWSLQAAAHVESSDNDVSAVMHVIPDDNPVSSKSTLITYYFGGKGGFDVRNCGCKLAVSREGRTISTAAVTALAGSGSEGEVTVTFADPGIYDLALSGKAGNKPFRIPFVVRVDTDSGSANVTGGLNVIFVSLASLVLLAMIAYYTISTGSRYAPKPKP